ncbi:MAG: HlyD family efflux transporter periplasmic adaptor subunit [Candidatus Obscuribacterales bacterium]|nr:HlyD family efflux transporter periplasmic adaptor subunit [Candidatus Obscuribacterales bacterium]
MTSERSGHSLAVVKFAALDKPAAMAHKALYVLGVLLMLFILWSAFVESDVCAEATGTIEPTSRVQVVRSSQQGMIEKYFVKDGQVVRKGEALVELNKVKAESELKEQMHQLRLLSKQIEQNRQAKEALEAALCSPPREIAADVSIESADRACRGILAARSSLENASYDTSDIKSSNFANIPDVQQLQTQQVRLGLSKEGKLEALRLRQSQAGANKRKLISKIETLHKEIEKARSLLEEQQTSLQYAEEELKIYEKANQLGVASGVKYLNAKSFVHDTEFAVLQAKSQLAQCERDLINAESDLKAADLGAAASSAEIKASIKSAESQIANLPLSIRDATRKVAERKANFDIAIVTAKAELAKANFNLETLERKSRELQDAILLSENILKDRIITAPVAGVVSQLIKLVPGESIQKGQSVATIVPISEELIVEAHVRSEDIGFVKPGEKVRLRISAFPCEEFGVVNGEVKWVDAYPEETVDKGGPDGIHVLTYRVHIVPDRTWIATGNQRHQLRVGLDVAADIVVRKRSMLTLLCEPFFKSSS